MKGGEFGESERCFIFRAELYFSPPAAFAPGRLSSNRAADRGKSRDLRGVEELPKVGLYRHFTPLGQSKFLDSFRMAGSKLPCNCTSH